MTMADTTTGTGARLENPYMPLRWFQLRPEVRVDRWRAQARGWLERHPCALPLAQRQDAETVLAELVLNALRYGGRGYVAGSVDVPVGGRTVRVEVWDSGDRRDPQFLRYVDVYAAADPRRPRVLAGFGLRIVTGLADQWGTDRPIGSRRRVWANITAPSRPTRIRRGASL